MKAPPGTRERIAKMSFASVYPHYLDRIERKDRTKKELHQVITWLTGYDNKEIKSLNKEKTTFEEFFNGEKIYPNANMIKGVICSYRIEELEDQLFKECRYLDKLVDELAKGRKMEKILRTEK